MGKIFEIRFLVPPILTILLIFIFSPENFSKLVRVKNLSKDLVIISPAVLLGLGFLISSTTEFFVNLTNARTSRKFTIIIREEKIKESSIKEYETWVSLDRVDKDNHGHVREQIHKRWGMAMANANSFISVVFANITIAVLLKYNFMNVEYIRHQCLFLLFTSMLCFIFITNYFYARNSVLYIDEVVRSLKK